MAEIWGAAIAAAVTVGAGAYSSKQAKDDAKKLAKTGQRDIGADIRSYLDAYGGAIPKLLKQEGKYRDDFQRLNLGEFQGFLQGGKGQQGLFGLSRLSQDAARRQLVDARGEDLRGMAKQAGKTRSLFDALSPEAAEQVKASTQMAADARLAAQGLTPQQERSAQQFAREGALSRGRVGDSSALASELLGREDVLAQKRQEAYGATNQAFGLANQFYSQPGLQQLNQTPMSYQAGQGLLGISLGSLGSSTPQLINPDVGATLGQVQGQNQLGAASAAAQANAAQRNAWMNAAGNAFSSYLQYR